MFTAEFVWIFCGLFSMNLINEHAYLHGRHKISDLLKKFKHEFIFSLAACFNNFVLYDKYLSSVRWIT